MTEKDREANQPRSVDALVREANDILDEAYWQLVETQGKSLTGIVVMFSGGNDSTVLAHLMRERATHFAHCNTTIGIEQTRQFVRDRAAEWNRPLIEVTPPPGSTYREMVVAHGFPGPASHWVMFRHLKERGMREVRRQFIDRPRAQRVIFLSGIRRAESSRRSERDDFHREGSIIWVSPLIHWTNAEMASYRAAFNVPRNEVADLIHMSGECLCGAFAKKNEIDEIGFFFPEVRSEIEALQVEVRAAGHPELRCTWGWGADRPISARTRSGPLCSSCEYRQEASELAASPALTTTKETTT